MKHDVHNEIAPVANFVARNDVDAEADQITAKILDEAFLIHRSFGPGLLESAYEECLAHAMKKKHDLGIERQKVMPLTYEGHKVDTAYRMDLVVHNKVIVEVKAAEKILPIHQAQLMTYLRLSGLRVGLILNFNATMLKDGIKRLVI